MKILIVEDSRRLRESLVLGLRRSGHVAEPAIDGAEGLRMARSGRFEIVLLDLGLPVMDGLEMLRRLRAAGDRTPVLALTARDAVPDRVAGLRAGADDYLVKPFDFDELLARIEALGRRTAPDKSPVIVFGGLSIDLPARRATVDGRHVDLTAREFSLLEYLARRRGRVVTRVEIEDHLYDGRVEPVSNVVDSTICLLRRKIDLLPGAASFITTRRGLGYVLETPGDTAGPAAPHRP